MIRTRASWFAALRSRHFDVAACEIMVDAVLARTAIADRQHESASLDARFAVFMPKQNAVRPGDEIRALHDKAAQIL